VNDESQTGEERGAWQGRAPSRIVVVDDHPLFRSALLRVLESQANLEVVGEAGDGEEAVEVCRLSRPELVLMDVMMPGMDGLQATRVIKSEFPLTVVLILTAFEDPDYLARALRAGAAGYVLKSAPIARIIDAVGKALTGELPLDGDVAARLLMRLMEETPQEEMVPEREESLPRYSLSPRETEVLRLMAQGFTNQQISRTLFVSVSTVKKHVRSVISKLGVSDRTQAAVKAVELGMLTERGGAE
jgi:DNA-binding NarL/FixJ family response regulator